MTPLQELLVNRRAELGRSYREAADKAGGLVSHGTLYNVERGIHRTKFTDDVLRGIALAYDLPLTQVQAAVGDARVASTEFRLPKKADQLTAADRRALLVMVDALLAAHQDAKDS